MGVCLFLQICAVPLSEGLSADHIWGKVCICCSSWHTGHHKPSHALLLHVMLPVPMQLPLHCRNLTSLESLEICGGAITDKGVAHMSALQNLQHLSLAQNSRISDTSLMVLSNLAALTFLNLSQSKLTGNGIQHLQSLQVTTGPLSRHAHRVCTIDVSSFGCNAAYQ